MDQLSHTGSTGAPGTRGRLLVAGTPQARADHPLAQGLGREDQTMPLAQLLGGKRRPEVRGVARDQLQRPLEHPGRESVVRGPASQSVDDPLVPGGPHPPTPPANLPDAETQLRGSLAPGELVLEDLMDDLQPIELSCRHDHALLHAPSLWREIVAAGP